MSAAGGSTEPPRRPEVVDPWRQPESPESPWPPDPAELPPDPAEPLMEPAELPSDRAEPPPDPAEPPWWVGRPPIPPPSVAELPRAAGQSGSADPPQPPVRRRQGAHRSQPDPLPWRERAIGAVLSFALVLAGVALLIATRAKPVNGNVAFVPKPAGTPGRPTARSSAPGQAAPGQAVTSPPPAGTPTPTRTPSQAAAHPALSVLNNSTVRGLATRSAARFAAAGWSIALVGNLHGHTFVTTVYYGPGQQAAARELARQFAGIRRVEPRYRGLPGNGLTVVLTRDFA